MGKRLKIKKDMTLIIWQENIKDKNIINYVGSIGRYSNIVEYYIDPFDVTKHIFHVNFSFYSNTFNECKELFNLLFRQFLIDVCNAPEKIKPLQPSIRLENRSICGYIADVEVFRACKDTAALGWNLKILPIVIRVDSIEEGRKIIEKKLNSAISNILSELIEIK